jgi:hypothetical protein
MAERAVMGITDVCEAIAWQADHAEKAAAPCTARVVRAQLAILDTRTELARRIREWPGLSLEDALPLRVAAGFHWLCLTGGDRRLEPVYAGELTDQAAIDTLVGAMAVEWDVKLVPWLDHPPQTNEAGRSASFVAALLWLSSRIGPRPSTGLRTGFEMNEIGASAGVNTMIERYRYDLGGVTVGPVESPMSIRPEWRGAPPPGGEVQIVAIRGCDLAPIDLSDPAEALRLKAYVWPDAEERMGRIEAATRLAADKPPLLERMDAATFVEERLEAPQAASVTRVIYHSIVWQYLPEAARRAITAAIEQAGSRATAERPLAWIRLETNRESFRHELTVRFWPGGDEPVLLAEAHPHGAWVEWRA